MILYITAQYTQLMASVFGLLNNRTQQASEQFHDKTKQQYL